MPTLSIKDVPERWAQALRQRAALNHRSLQGELMAIVESALQDAPMPADNRRRGNPRVTGYDRAGHATIQAGWKTVAQVAADLKAKFPDGVGSQMSSIEIIRQDRDSR